MSRYVGIAVAGFAACLLSASPASAGSLGTVDTYDTGGFVFGTGIADFDRDGKTDLIVANDASAEGDHFRSFGGRATERSRRRATSATLGGPRA